MSNYHYLLINDRTFFNYKENSIKFSEKSNWFSKLLNFFQKSIFFICFIQLFQKFYYKISKIFPVFDPLSKNKFFGILFIFF